MVSLYRCPMSADRIKDYGLVAYLIVLGGQVKLNEDGKSYCYLGTEFENINKIIDLTIKI